MKPKILVPYDFSVAADAALAWAVDMQRSTRAGPLHLIYAISSFAPAVGESMVGGALPPDEFELATLEGSLSDVAREARASAVVKAVIAAGAIGDIILDQARELDADLIVMGTHARGPLKRFFLGSVADHVVRHATCPVVTIRGLDASAARVPTRQAV